MKDNRQTSKFLHMLSPRTIWNSHKRWILTLIVALTVLYFVAIRHEDEPSLSEYYMEGKFIYREGKSEPHRLHQDNPILIDVIRRQFLIPPSTLPYHLTTNVDDPSKGQSKIVRELLKNKKNGFFIEAGAYKGEEWSNSLYLERFLGWQGVLVEPDPSHFEILATKNRKAWSIHACLSVESYPDEVTFSQENLGSKIINNKEEEEKKKSKNVSMVNVHCFPIYSIMLALNTTTIDYFSLDVESVELDVLRTIPWDKVDITVFSIEFIFLKEGVNALISFMENLGYINHKKIGGDGIGDVIFYHPELLKKTLGNQ